MNYTSCTMSIIDSLRLKRRGCEKNLNLTTCSGWKIPHPRNCKKASA